MRGTFGQNSFAIIANARKANRTVIADQRCYLIDPTEFRDPLPVCIFGRGDVFTRVTVPAPLLRRYRVQSVTPRMEEHGILLMDQETAELYLSIYETFNSVDDPRREETLQGYVDG